MAPRKLLATLLAATALATVAEAAPAPLGAELERTAARLAAVRADIQMAQLQPSAQQSAALVARLQALEEELRRLTGRVEEVEHAQRQLETRLQRFLAQQPDQQGGQPLADAAQGAPTPLVQAEPASPAQGRPTPLTPRQEPATTATRPAPPPATTSTIEPDEAARRGYVLGTVPEDALRGQPVPRQPDLPAPGQGAGSQARLDSEGASAPASYEAGLELLQANRWAEAEQAFTGFIQANPNDPRAATASYWLGETYLLRKDYPTAAAVFARNYRTYGEDSSRAPDNLLKLGVALSAMGQRDKACQSFAELAKRHPNASTPIRQALARERASASCS
jgi:tol-pal system protein YbgF